MLKLPDS